VHGLDGVECSVLTAARRRSGRVERDGRVRVVRAPECLRIASTPFTPAWRRLLRRADADLLHFHMPNAFGELAYLAARPDVPMVATYHADVVGRRAGYALFAPFQQRFLACARRIVVSSPALRDGSAALARHRERTVVVPFGVNAAYWAERPPDADAVRARHRPPIVLFLGRLRYYKGVEVLIDAMTGVDATLVVAGDGPRRAALERRARATPRGARVTFVGEVPDDARRAYYHAADVFVLPSTSRAEAFGIAMLEAMACGAPVVSTEVGTGTSWVNRHGVSGLVVPPADAAALGAAVRDLLADEARRRVLGAAAAARVRERFTRAAMLDALAAIYASTA
jgi:glycosyltransferase involved in cell wall biosynthesis